MSKKRLIGSAILTASVLGLAALCPADATIGLGQAASNSANATINFYHLLLDIFMIVGVMMVGGGFMAMYQAHKQQQSMSKGLASVVIGIVLTGLPFFIGSGSTTIYGSNQSQISQLGN